MDELLPVGSIVALGDNGELRVMILGYYPRDDVKKQVFQYISVPWPMGITVPGNTIFLNNDQIHEVYYQTPETEESKTLCKVLPVIGEIFKYDSIPGNDDLPNEV